jgi:hypothetical protein
MLSPSDRRRTGRLPPGFGPFRGRADAYPECVSSLPVIPILIMHIKTDRWIPRTPCSDTTSSRHGRSSARRWAPSSSHTSQSSCRLFSRLPRCEQSSLFTVRASWGDRSNVLTRPTADEDQEEDREGWETITMDGQQIGIRTSAIEEKCQAFETLVIYCSTLGARFAPYLMQALELALPALRFYFHEGVREAASM